MNTTTTSATSSGGGGGGISHEKKKNQRENGWIRGVNIGGWLVLERYITPYQFALTDCHVDEGKLCWYPGQLGAPPSSHDDYQTCDLYQCKPLPEGYPLDEWTLARALRGRAATPEQVAERKASAERWLNYHFEYFVSFDDLVQLKNAGVTHVRVPLPHWILGTSSTTGATTNEEEEIWIVGDRWKYFVRLCRWARELELQVWPDIHTAPGSQNGFDNSGRAGIVTCRGWSENAGHVARSLQVIKDITAAIVDEGVNDVVTGFGLLNEPFKDCNRNVFQQYAEDARAAVHANLGRDTSVYISDMFLATTFNNGWWWLDPAEYQNTYLDSHYYHVFAEDPRSLSPRQHIAYVCRNEYRDVTSCCYTDGPTHNPTTHTNVSRGVQRLVGEWSAAYDILPQAMLDTILLEIAVNGTAAHFDRQLSPARMAFLQHFVQAQMVAYEAADIPGLSAGWFYWNFKMEGGAFAEWDFLRGVREGWIPGALPDPYTDSQSVHGNCTSIIFRTDDSMSVIHEYPDPSTIPTEPRIVNDDVVLSHGDSLLGTNTPHNRYYHRHNYRYYRPQHHAAVWVNWILFPTAVVFCLILARVTYNYIQGRSSGRRRKGGGGGGAYTSIGNAQPATAADTL